MISDFLLMACSLGLGSALVFYFASLETCTPNWIRGGTLAIVGAISTFASSWAFFQISVLAIVMVGISIWALLMGTRMVWNYITDKD